MEFENKFDFGDREIISEFISLKYRQTEILIGIASVLLFFGLMTLLDANGLPMPLIIIAFLSSPLLLIRKKRHIKHMLKEMQVFATADNAAGNDYKSTFSDGDFMVNEISFGYDRITKVDDGKLCLYLTVDKTVTAIVKKDAFVSGDFASFVRFLRERLKDKPNALRVLNEINVR